MKWIIITTPTFISHEAKYIDQLFEAGIDLLHLRKPDSTPEECEQLLQKIDPKWYPQIVIHDHFELCGKYHLHGIHLNRRNNQIPENFQGSLSRSCHSFKEVIESIDNTNPDSPKGSKSEFDYVFLSPIFDSISKKGYKHSFSNRDLEDAGNSGNRHKNRRDDEAGLYVKFSHCRDFGQDLLVLRKALSQGLAIVHVLGPLFHLLANFVHVYLDHF